LPTARPTPLPQDYQRLGWTTFLRHPVACLLPVGAARSPRLARRLTVVRALSTTDSAWACQSGYGNINPLSIDYACRPRLRSRLTLGGLACPRNPWSSGGRVSHPSFATHACILTRAASTARSPCRFSRRTTLPYPSTRLDAALEGLRRTLRECHSFGGVLEPRYIVGAESLDQ
jgi:hypothetical protein